MYLELKNIHKSFGSGDNRTEVLRGISCGVEKGDICVLLGPSGSGKSTLLNIIGGIETADEGSIIIDGETVENMNDKQLSLYRRKHLGYVFQSYNLIPNLTVKENIETGAYLSNDPLPLDDMLKTLGLWEHKDKIPNQLSGGQQQRTAIGRAIIKNPDILLCDEPTGALDYKTSKEILKLIETVNQKFGNTVILVTHNDAIRHMADQVIKLHDGQIRHNDKNEQKIPAVDLDWLGGSCMKNPLHKRYLRELKQDAGKYLVLFLFLTLTIGFVSGFQVADSSMTKAYDESFEKYKIEDGHFTLAVKADKELKSKLKKEHLKLSEIFYKDVERKNEHSVRIYTQNDDVNKICVMDGKFPENKDEIIIDRLYAENNGIAIGDKFDVDGKKFTVSGVAAFSNYSALFKNNTDMMFDANKFTVAMVTKKGFERFSDDELHYCYAYRWNYRGYSEQKASDKSDDVKDILKETGLLTDFVKASDNQAITFTGEDMGGDLVMIITLLYIVMVVLAFVFAVTTRSTIEKEASTIGTLRALGYTRGELIRHYLTCRSGLR